MVHGPTGSGKTALLRGLAARGETVLDLEAFARHRGSAFGGFGMPPQPSHREFDAVVTAAWEAADPGRPVWVELKGEYLGSVGVPRWLLSAMRDAPRLEVRRPRRERVVALVAEYAVAPLSQWLAAVDRIQARLGAARADRVRDRLAGGDWEGAVGDLLDYYDQGYRRWTAGLRGPRLAPADGVRGRIA